MIIILPKYVADISICQMEGSFNSKNILLTYTSKSFESNQPFAGNAAPRYKPTCISSREYVLL